MESLGLDNFFKTLIELKENEAKARPRKNIFKSDFFYRLRGRELINRKGKMAGEKQ